jgi:hypothetical protein
MQPESSDGFASVGTILPEEGAALLPGGSFRFKGIIVLALPFRDRGLPRIQSILPHTLRNAMR